MSVTFGSKAEEHKELPLASKIPTVSFFLYRVSAFEAAGAADATTSREDLQGLLKIAYFISPSVKTCSLTSKYSALEGKHILSPRNNILDISL